MFNFLLACDSGKWGNGCEQFCGACVEATCDPVSGHCKSGCKAGYQYTPWCDKGMTFTPCSSNGSKILDCLLV